LGVHAPCKACSKEDRKLWEIDRNKRLGGWDCK
jgi:hypothetical protein